MKEREENEEEGTLTLYSGDLLALSPSPSIKDSCVSVTVAARTGCEAISTLKR